MPRIALTALVTVILSVAIVAIGLTLDFSGFAYFVALLIAGFFISLTDRERFYGSPAPR